MVTFITRSDGVLVTDSDISKFIPFADVVKFSKGSYNNKFIVRVAHKNGLYMLYTDDSHEAHTFLNILEKGCGRRSCISKIC